METMMGRKSAKTKNEAKGKSSKSSAKKKG